LAVLRIIGAVLPQILLLLIIGSSLDLLGGWNHTDSSTSVLMALFLLNPLVTAVLLIVEIVRYQKKKKQEWNTVFVHAWTGLIPFH